jgi:hypothetical protein
LGSLLQIRGGNLDKRLFPLGIGMEMLLHDMRTILLLEFWKWKKLLIRIRLKIRAENSGK